MNTAPQRTTLNIRQSLTCAALAALTTLGIFSLVATGMPPLLSDLPSLAGNHEVVACAPTVGVQNAGAPNAQSAI